LGILKVLGFELSGYMLEKSLMRHTVEAPLINTFNPSLLMIGSPDPRVRTGFLLPSLKTQMFRIHRILPKSKMLFISLFTPTFNLLQSQILPTVISLKPASDAYI
jgi:hypothetical protein